MDGRRWWLVAAAVLFSAVTPRATEAASGEEEMTCGSATVRQAFQALLAERLCLNDNIKLSDLTMSLAMDEQAVGLEDTITTAITEMPPTRTCEALLSFETKVSAEAIGPGPGIVYRLAIGGEPRPITYKVGRFDDGRLYVRPSPGCWKIDRIRQRR